MSREVSIECPNCGEESIKALRKSNHSSRSNYSGGITYDLLDKKCEECGNEDLKKELKSAGYKII